jgi:hypothetical protein
MKLHSMRLFLVLFITCMAFGSVSGSFAEELADTGYPAEITSRLFQKRVGLTFFKNSTACQDDRLVTITDKTITDYLQESCSDVFLVKDENQAFSELRNRQPRHVSGIIDNLTLAMQGRKLGLNAIITGEISEIKGVQEELGYLWLKQMVFFVHVHVLIEVYDTETGAKLLDKYVSEEGEISEDAYYKINSKDFTPAFPVIENLLVSLSGKLADEACELLEDEPFKTYVKSTDGKRITVTAGRNAGIAKGSLFNIHDASRIISGKDGHEFIISGPVTGKLQIDTVYEDSAEGLIVEGENKGMDSCLKLLEE